MSIDATGHANTGVWTGGLTAGAPGALANDSDPAMTFNGSTGQISTTLNVSPAAMPSTTWEGWVYPTYFNGWKGIFSSDNGGFDRSVYLNGSNFAVWTGNSWWQTVPADLNSWQHIAVVYTSSSVTFYKNGVASTCTCTPNFDGSSRPLIIGTRPDGFRANFQGTIDEVAIYPTALTAGRIQYHYRLGGKILVRRSEFDAWMAAYRRVGQADVARIVDSVMRDLRGT